MPPLVAAIESLAFIAGELVWPSLRTVASVPDTAGGGKECQTPTTMKGFELTRSRCAGSAAAL